MNPPAVLHRYFSYEGALFFLKSAKFSSVDGFNDPFEFLPRTEQTREIFQGLVKAGIVSSNSSIGSSAVLTSALSALGIGVGSFISIPILLLAIKLYFTYKYRQDSYVKRIKTIHDYYEKLIKKFYVCCFSEVDDSLLMWGHYTRNHTGVVISFKTAVDYFGYDFRDIKYTNDRIQVPSYFGLEKSDPLVTDNWQRDLLTSKAECWSYEKEWRCIKQTDDLLKDKDGTHLLIDRNSVLKIVFGCRILEQNKQELLKLIKEGWPDVRIVEAWPHDFQYSIKFNEYTGSEIIL